MDLGITRNCLKFLAVCFCCNFISYSIRLEKTLPHFEKLNMRDFHHRVYRRSVGENSPTMGHDRDIAFSSHGQKLVMILTQSKEIFDSAFIVVSVDKHGKETPVHINTDYFYKGYVKGYPSSYVTAHLDDDGLMTATVSMPNETYVVEPMWRHVDGDPSHDVIVYKASDVKSNVTSGRHHASRCGYVDVEMDTDASAENNRDTHKKRYRRSTCLKTASKDTCKLHLVADYLFCKNVGRGNPKTTTYYMLQVIIEVNKMFRRTCWDGVGEGYGVDVKKVSVHCDGFSTDPAYNSNHKWGIDSLLSEFSRHDWSAVCLAHLFTYQDFDNGVLGLAYVGDPKTKYGGICSKNLQGRHHNCGITSYINWGRRLTALEANIVTSHEIGHNFGARHDPGKCAPGGAVGNYIMYAYSVTGQRQNNNQFSSCSRQQVGALISARESLPGCLEKASGSVCGNDIVENDEQCDEGDDRKCCTKDCKFISGATCSDTNSICCHECKTAPKDLGKVCRASYTYGCQGETQCDGTSTDCPKESPKLTSGECIISMLNQKGGCNDQGVCESVCHKIRAEPCRCSGDNACKVCCTAPGGTCTPYIPELNEIDGVPCNVSSGNPGYCSEVSGKCQEIQRDVKQTFANLFKDFTLDKAVQWMRSNIVITILVFSLLIWIPAGAIVTIVEKHEKRKYEELEEAEQNEYFARIGTPKKARKIRTMNANQFQNRHFEQ